MPSIILAIAVACTTGTVDRITENASGVPIAAVEVSLHEVHHVPAHPAWTEGETVWLCR